MRREHVLHAIQTPYNMRPLLKFVSQLQKETGYQLIASYNKLIICFQKISHNHSDDNPYTNVRYAN